MTRTDHSDLITELRAVDSIEDTAASDLLEMHDATGLNLHQAPRLLAFVEDRIEKTAGAPFRVEDNEV